MSSSKAIFPNYMQMRAPLPMPVWHVLRGLSVLAVIGLIFALSLHPETGLFILWGLLVPTLPFIWFLIPGLWRNICPLAAFNQLPRLFNFTRGLTLGNRLREYSYIIGISLFLIIVPNRLLIFNKDGPTTALLIAVILMGAFVGGMIFKGKSGWCSTFCPLLPVQRIYGQTPYIMLPNSHCQPCLGCTKNCYDFNPSVAYLADLYDDDRYYSGYRKFFVGIFPGFIVAFYTAAVPPTVPLWATYGHFVIYGLISLGVFFAIDSFAKVSTNKTTTIFAMLALNIYYWFNIPTFTNSLGQLLGLNLPLWLIWALRLELLALSIIWIRNSYFKERIFLEQVLASTTVQVGSGRALKRQSGQGQAEIEVTFMPEERRVIVEAGRPLLEIAEKNGFPIEPGCRMGVCGADPVAILEGMENLSPVEDDEQATLERLGFAGNTRMACMARVGGHCSLSLTPQREEVAAAASVSEADYDPDVENVVIIGNGIAGVTAADYVRRNHPTCDIHLIGRETHHLYNRMGISRLIYGRSAMHGLYLLPENWYDDHNITCWLNTQVVGVTPKTKAISLATNETLSYDKLILATGSRSYVPDINGTDLVGSFVLREADDAMAIRSYMQLAQCKRAVVAGGGLLGLEAGYALLKLGLQVTILERSGSLLRRQLDDRGGELLRQYLEKLGIHILFEANTRAVDGHGRVERVHLEDGRTIQCEIFLICAGIRSNVELAEQAGLKVKRGVLVDDAMRTNEPDIYAVGDLAEHRGHVYGLWPVAVEQAKVAAMSAVASEAKRQTYSGIVPVTMLKVVGVELTSIGRINPESDEETVIALEDVAENRYRKLVICAGKIVGAILYGYPSYAPTVTTVVKKEIDVSPVIDSLQAGEWDVLESLTR